MYIPKLRIPLSIYSEATEFTVVGQTLVHKYVDNTPTEEVECIMLELHDASKLNRFEVKVPGTTLPFKDDAVESQSIKVSLQNPLLSPYKSNKTNRIEYSVKADGFKELKKG